MSSIIDSFYRTSTAYSVNLSSSTFTEVGQSFTGNGTKINKTRFVLKKFNNPTGYAYSKVYAHNGIYGTSSLPTGTALAISNPIDVSTFSTSFQLITFTFPISSRITLINGTYYVITVAFSGTASPNFISAVYSKSSYAIHSGNRSQCDHTAGWVGGAVATEDLHFYVYKYNPATTGFISFM